MKRKEPSSESGDAIEPQNKKERISFWDEGKQLTSIDFSCEERSKSCCDVRFKTSDGAIIPFQKFLVVNSGSKFLSDVMELEKKDDAIEIPESKESVNWLLNWFYRDSQAKVNWLKANYSALGWEKMLELARIAHKRDCVDLFNQCLVEILNMPLPWPLSGLIEFVSEMKVDKGLKRVADSWTRNAQFVTLPRDEKNIFTGVKPGREFWKECLSLDYPEHADREIGLLNMATLLILVWPNIDSLDGAKISLDYMFQVLLTQRKPEIWEKDLIQKILDLAPMEGMTKTFFKFVANRLAEVKSFRRNCPYCGKGAKCPDIMCQGSRDY